METTKIAVQKKTSTTRNGLSNKTTLMLMAIPCVAFIFIFNYVPLLGWILAFFDYKPALSFAQQHYVGLKYFKIALNDSEIINVLKNTLIISFFGLLSSVFPVIFAILLSEMRSKKYQKVIQTVTTLPYFISWILVYSVVFLFLSSEGVVNTLLFNLHWIDKAWNPLADNDIVWYFQTFLGIWKGVGFSAIIYLASIAAIDPEMYDAANVDGASRFRMIWHITIPGLVPTYITLLLLGIGNILSNGFDQFYVFYNPLVHGHIEVLDYYVYRIGFGASGAGSSLNDFSLSTVLGMYKTIISVALLFTANAISKKLRGQSVI
jgi:putative aldouronate transport system permease protein